MGELIDLEESKTLEDIRRYGDIGLCLAGELKKKLEEAEIRNFQCPEKIQATVIRAGMHSMQLSGSTICYDGELLPIKNRPVIVMDADLFSEGVSQIQEE